MAIEIRPATDFDDVKTRLGPDANVCWCLSYRIPSRENRELVGEARGERVRQLLDHGPIGLVASDDDGGRGLGGGGAARRHLLRPEPQDPPMSTTSTCGILRSIRVRPAHRGEGISHQLLAGAVDSARDRGAPAIEGYPGDNRGEKVDLTMAYVGHGVCSSVPGSRTPPTPTRSSTAFPGY